MSLKAKLEAVIYAAEEPVTLAQLAFLFAAEALEWKAQQDAARAAQTAEQTSAALDSPLETGPQIAPLDYLEAAPAVEEPQPIAPEPASAGETAPVAPSESLEEDAEPQSPADPAAETRRHARQQDREVRAILRELLDELIAASASDGRGVEIREIAGGYRMATKPEYHDAVRAFVKSLKPPLKLSMPALETLAVIAYKQPVTAPEVNEIRGVDSSAVFGSLLARKLIATAGRKPVIGRPILYKTTREFLLRFGLKDVSELPSMEEFEKLAASELDEAEPTSESAPTPETSPDLQAEPDGDSAPAVELGPAPEVDPVSAAPPSAPESAETENLP